MKMATGEKERTSNCSHYIRQTTPEQKDLDLQIEMELQHPSFPLCRFILFASSFIRVSMFLIYYCAEIVAFNF